MIDEFTIRGDTDWLRITLDRVYDFPERTSFFGGYDVAGAVALRCGAYQVHGHLSCSTGEVWAFYTALKVAYDALAGEARFVSSEGNLEFMVTFTSRGHWTLHGTYQEYDHIPLKLIFEMQSEQSYLPDTLSQLARLVEIYGDNRGIRR